MAYDPTTQVTDDLTDNLAEYHNELVDAAAHVMSSSAYSSYVRTQSMTGNVTLTDSDFPIQSFSPTAARDLALPAIATTNHAFYITNRSSTYEITVKNASSSVITVISPETSCILYSDGFNGWYASPNSYFYVEIASTPANPSSGKWKLYFKSDGLYYLDDAGTETGPLGGGGGGTYGDFFGEDGFMLNGKISVTVASNNLTVAIKTLANADPSSGDPVYIRINNTVRSITAALSVTKNAGTNWFGSGASEHATIERDYFVYLIWNTTPATDIVDIGFALRPHFRVYSEASSTSTSDSYLAYGNASAPTSTDNMVVIGRFAATLSAGAGYTWTVPTFTSANLIQRPIDRTRWISWTPTYTGFSSNPTSPAHYYQIIGDHIWCKMRQGGNGTSNANTFTISNPMTSKSLSGLAYDGMGTGIDNGAAKTTPIRVLVNTTVFDVYSDMTTATGWTASGGKRIGTAFIDYAI